MQTSNSSPFLRLPAEIRLMIYEILILPFPTIEDSDRYTLHISTIDPLNSCGSPKLLRTAYHSHPPPGPLQYYRTLLTTWTLTPSISATHLYDTLPSLLLLNRQIYNEAATILYSTYTLSFGTSIDAIAPFFGDLSPAAKCAVRKVQMAKRALPWVSSSGEADWSAACATLAALTNPRLALSGQMQDSELRLSHFTLTVETATRPLQKSTWDCIKPATAADWARMLKLCKRGGGKVKGDLNMLWVEEVRGIKVAKGGVVKVEKVAARCPPLRSQQVWFWMLLSMSVEEGFAEWMGKGMVSSEEELHA